MSWLQVKVQVNRDRAEQLEDLLLAAGALAVTFEDNADQPILEPALGETPLWEQTLLTGLFAADIDTNSVDNMLLTQVSGITPRWEPLEDRDWEREWIKDYQPIHCGEKLVICPSWHTPDDSPDNINLLLDPGLAFGTGTHPTTFLCLQWLEQQQLEGLTVIDYGCGSGILAIASLLLGAKSALCVDIDPQALLATRENARRNNIDPARIITCLPEEKPTTPAEIVMANILAGPLVALARDLTDLTAPGGKLCLSGILANQAETVAREYQRWFTLSPANTLDGWAQLSAVKTCPS